ncbi:hypothetical protein [Streptomyces klenkii]
MTITLTAPTTSVTTPATSMTTPGPVPRRADERNYGADSPTW